MANEWFYARNNQQAGPVMWEQLQQLASNGALTGSDMVWTQGMGNWVAAATVPGLFPAAPSIAPSPTPYAGAPSSPNTVPLGPLSGSAYAGGQQQPGAPWLGYYTPNIYAPGAQPHYAGFWIRFVAAFIDGMILFVGKRSADPISAPLN